MWLRALIVGCMAFLFAQSAIAAENRICFHEAEVTPHPYVGMTLDEIKALPDFTPIENGSKWIGFPSSAKTSAEPNAPLAFNWIGYVEVFSENYPKGTFVVLDDTGAGVTMVWHGNPYGDPIPAWFVGTLGFLYDIGFLEGCP